MNARPQRRADGFTLLEVILALAVLAVALAIVGEANSGADRNAHRAALESDATLVAESVMAELVAGVREPVPIDGVAWDEGDAAARWLFSVAIEPAPYNGLIAARVSAYEREPLGRTAARATIVRWFVDPATLPADPNPDTQAGAL